LGVRPEGVPHGEGNPSVFLGAFVFHRFQLRKVDPAEGVFEGAHRAAPSRVSPLIEDQGERFISFPDYFLKHH
jgi:hypothetical protein